MTTKEKMYHFNLRNISVHGVSISQVVCTDNQHEDSHLELYISGSGQGIRDLLDYILRYNEVANDATR